MRKASGDKRDAKRYSDGTTAYTDLGSTLEFAHISVNTFYIFKANVNFLQKNFLISEI